MWLSIAFGAVLMLLSVLMALRQQRAHRMLEQEELGSTDRKFFGQQHRRRMRATGLIGLLGGMIVVGNWLTEDLVISAAYWCVALILVIWMALLAIADLNSTRAYYFLLRDRQLAEHARLEAELARLKNRDANGRHSPQTE